MFNCPFETFVNSKEMSKYEGKVQLVFTSPPFPLNHKKKYGNRQGKEYVDWLASLAPTMSRLLTSNGSIVIEIGNSWEPGEPVMSTLALRALLAFLDNGHLKLCQEFICHNPARLPSPIQWVNIERCRVKDSYTHVWWMSPTARPKADNRRVLTEYSESMKRLLRRKTYNSGKRPSGYGIGQTSFFSENEGAIPASVLYEAQNLLIYANTSASDDYMEHCKTHNLELHPARMQVALAEFFVKFLTTEDDYVLDPFAGSNTTGAVAEALKRNWIGIEAKREYAESSISRFNSQAVTKSRMTVLK
jgi:DNA modification methylase